MSSKPFMTNQESLEDLLDRCHKGYIQLPDFQRNWVWDQDRLIGLISSVSQAFPIGAVMTLRTGGSLKFQHRRIDGVSKGSSASPEQLILDGQQRLTSLYQSIYSNKPLKVKASDSGGKKKIRWLYFNLRTIAKKSMDRELSIEVADENRIIKSVSKGKDNVDLSTSEKEYKELMFPVSQIFHPDKWEGKYNDYWISDLGLEEAKKYRKIFKKFKNRVLKNFAYYEVPVITLAQSLSREAICVVFEKVNTGGKQLDAFELLTAKFAAEQEGGYDLRERWGSEKKGIYYRLINWTSHNDSLGFKIDPTKSVLCKVQKTDFLQAISLIKTYNNKMNGKSASISGKRKDLLNLKLQDFEYYKDRVEIGFIRAAEFLYSLKIMQSLDLPYRSQLVPLAVMLANIEDWRKPEIYQKLSKWYWCGVFGELYSSANETRMAWDVEQMPIWMEEDNRLPSTVNDAIFRPNRLESMRDRKSASYKGVIAVLLNNSLKDLYLGKEVSEKIFFDKGIDMHHIFPTDWCKKNNKIGNPVWNSIINKTPLSRGANRSIKDRAPSNYIPQFDEQHSIDEVDAFLKSHLIDPSSIRNDKFEEFIESRKVKLNELVRNAMGK